MARTAADPGITKECLRGWVKQDCTDRGEDPRRTTVQSRELRNAPERIRELEDEVKIFRRSTVVLGSGAADLRRSTR